MIPYDGTPIKDKLAAEGRLRGDVCDPDYDFLDPRLYDFYIAVNELLNITGWIHGLRALSPQLKFAWSEVAVIERLFPSVPGVATYKATLKQLTQTSNAVLFDVVEDLVHAFVAGRRASWSAEVLQDQCRGFVEKLLRERNGFILRCQPILLRALNLEERLAG